MCHQKQELRIQQLDQRLQDEVAKVKSGMLLDMNLERSRATECVRISSNDISIVSEIRESWLHTESFLVAILNFKMDAL